MEDLSTQDPPLSLQGVPFDQKWELLKPTIERLYLQDGLKLPEVITSIRDRHGFDASESQYKYQINRKWKLKKSTSTTKKVALYQVIQKRAEAGKSSAVTRRGKTIDTKNLRRYLKKEARKNMDLQLNAIGGVGDIEVFSSRVFQFGKKIFMNWNMPYGTMMGSTSNTLSNHASPLSDMIVDTPPSQQNAPSPTSVAVQAMAVTDRTRLFTQGRHNEMLKSMDKQQRITVSTWMYQFWYFSFKTAKHWGHGPQEWTADMLRFNDYHLSKTISGSSPNTPGACVGTPATHYSPGDRENLDQTTNNKPQAPPSLCRWSIHYMQPSYQGIPSPPTSPRNLDFDNEQDWPQWSDSQSPNAFMKKLGDNLASNDFSSVSLDHLPLATNQIAEAARRSPQELFEEALGFAIMGGNADLIFDIRSANVGLKLIGSFPFHLAISYLRGSRTCCNVLDAIQECYPTHLRKLFVNDLGHTILDQIMLAILKSHTSCSPGIVDRIFEKEKHFQGDNVDICGRWDADSDCVRELLAQGTSSIPFGWKHMFCHTSIQSICHCIGTVFGPAWAPDINTPSGLFTKRCVHCGARLALLPLHTFVLVGVHLSLSGCKDENLFGMLACLLCLLRNGANPLLRANISIRALLGDDESNGCEHEDLDPLVLAETVLDALRPKLSQSLTTGWQIICSVLKRSQSQCKNEPSSRESSVEPESDEELDTIIERGETSNDTHVQLQCADEFEHSNMFGDDKILSTLWAAVQTELLTYRRVKEGDGWTSQHFDLESLMESLLDNEIPRIGLVQQSMMKQFCSCGDSIREQSGGFYPIIPACPLMDDVAAYYFANLEDWNRSNFIPCPENRHNSWYFNYGDDK